MQINLVLKPPLPPGGRKQESCQSSKIPSLLVWNIVRSGSKGIQVDCSGPSPFTKTGLHLCAFPFCIGALGHGALPLLWLKLSQGLLWSYFLLWCQTRIGERASCAFGHLTVFGVSVLPLSGMKLLMTRYGVGWGTELPFYCFLSSSPPFSFQFREGGPLLWPQCPPCSTPWAFGNTNLCLS